MINNNIFKNNSILTFCLIVSIILHSSLLLIKFVGSENIKRVFRDSPLEVILVNVKANEQEPNKIQAIAQITLSGGGEALDGRSQSPLPYSELNINGDFFENTNKEIKSLEEKQMNLLLQIKEKIDNMTSSNSSTKLSNEEGKSKEQRTQRLLKLLAEVENKIQEENARPKKHYISPATRAKEYAVYYDALRRIIEAKGTQHFPEYNGEKLYGELVIMMTINYDGSVLNVKTLQSSGNSILDSRAEAIARASSPFEPFDSNMHSKADQLVLVSIFKFTSDGNLESNIY